MCDFVSWIKKDNTILFLTANDVFNTQRGKDLQAFCQDKNDVVGHGAIRRYYGLTKGNEKECTDFNTPDNFPDEIVTAIKTGQMNGLPVKENVLVMLKPEIVASCKPISKAKAVYDKGVVAFDKAYAAYDKAKAVYDKGVVAFDKAYAAYDKVYDARNNLVAAYDKADAAYDKVKAAYDKVKAAYYKADDAYDKVKAAYNKAINDNFWKLFDDVKNRVKVWK